MIWGPNAAFLALTGGVLLLFCELIFPLKSVAGALGAIAVTMGVLSLWSVGGAREAVLLLLAAGGSFVLELYFLKRWAAAVTGVLLLVWAATRLTEKTGINGALAFMGTITLGAASLILATAARQARTNKRCDVKD